MAHFANLDTDNNVMQVVVISNADILDEHGQENETIGINLCQTLIGQGTWIQTSFNNNFRKMFGQPGMKYALDKDVFYNPTGPAPSWILDNNYDWQPPTPYPDDGKSYRWDEPTLAWIEVISPEE